MQGVEIKIWNWGNRIGTEGKNKKMTFTWAGKKEQLLKELEIMRIKHGLILRIENMKNSMLSEAGL